MSYPTCQHTKSDGILCGSPALRDKLFCYYHQHRAERMPRLTEIPRGESLVLDAINNRINITTNISLVITALASGRIDYRRANHLIRGLELASKSFTQIERLLLLR
ncbi:hypothetical protein [Granulicella arctica]|uniref:hypothetical protein n=1 Tax=Granulicella arctica TaxID=940613 RepID=UPI0021DFF84A|nr:hypothetical protein [Granulicella arctica]